MTSTVYTPTSTTTSQCKNEGPLPIPTIDLSTGVAVRKASRENAHKTSTSGLAPSYLQANLIILPSKFASDFRILCARNPVPCPLLAESRSVGRWDAVKSWLEGVADSAIASDINLAKDAPRYMVYKDGELVKFECDDVMEEWTEDHIAFLVGCSYSFESALSSAGLTARHTTMGRNTTMYRTNIPLCPAGVFTGGTYVVSMRPYKLEEIEQVRAITRPYIATHGEPIAWGWKAVKDLGIQDIDKPEWGAAPLTLDGKALSQVEGDTDNVPVFWGCGVTPQEAVMRARLPGISMGHAPGHMLVLDCRDWDIVKDN